MTKNILVVMNEKQSAASVSLVLENAGHKVYTALNDRDIDFFMNHDYQIRVIIIDPEGHLEKIQQLRIDKPGCKIVLYYHPEFNLTPLAGFYDVAISKSSYICHLVKACRTGKTHEVLLTSMPGCNN